jgi:Mrp family chromosome partitioning ATPase
MDNCESCAKNGTCESKEGCNVVNNPLNKIGRVIGVMSGKGGVGKSSVAVLLAQELNRRGRKVGILDADITGPSIPRLMGLSHERALSDDTNIIPVEHENGIKTMSLNYLIEKENEPVIWRGPMISGVVEQFWKEVLWGEVDDLIVDMPPGTSDVALTVLQSYPVNGVVMVTLAQDMVSMIVSKAVNMAQKMNVPVWGVVENMSYMRCPDCGKKMPVYADENGNDELKELGINKLGELPMTRTMLNMPKQGLDGVEDELKNALKDIVDKL